MGRQDGKENFGKVELLRKSRELHTKRQALISQAKILKSEYKTLLEEFQPRIDNLQSIANNLAPEFKRLYKESQEVYSEGDGASAKILSIQGHAVQDKCEAVNAETNAMRAQLKNILNQIGNFHKKAEDLETQSGNYREEAEALRPTPVRGFNASKIINNEEIEEFLDEFPQKIFKEIESIRFSDNVSGNSFEMRLGISHKDRRTNKSVITMFRDLFREEKSKEKMIEEFKMTIAHEVGHTVFEKFMDDKSRWKWGEVYQASMLNKRFITAQAEYGRADDFCECFAMFKVKPKKLEKFDEARYDFIKKVYSTLEKTGEKNNEKD